MFYLAASESTVLGCGVATSETNDGVQLLPVDISDYKIDKVRPIQCHASQHPPLEGKPEEEVDKIPCYEYFTLAHKGIDASNTDDWFECVNKETL